MKFDISFADNLNVPFSDLVDKDLWEVYEVKGIENGWMVRRKEIKKEKHDQST